MNTNPTLEFKPQYQEFNIHQALGEIRSHADWCSIRYVNDLTHHRSARNGKPNHNALDCERGAMVEVIVDGSLAYAGTSDLSKSGLLKAVKQAALLAQGAAKSSAKKLLHYTPELRPPAIGKYSSPRKNDLDTSSLAEFTRFLIEASNRLKVSDKITNSEAASQITESWQHYVSTSGADFCQNYLFITSNFEATAQDGSHSQKRSISGPVARCHQIGLETYNKEHIYSQCEMAGRQALELLSAEDCPSDIRDLILSPDQMYLQIHESIGHPLEMDRILGDERNYAGWSFVKLSDFGHLQYGSQMMNVTFDPTVTNEFASYAFDDCGNKATREYLIKDGVLLRGLGSIESQKRSGLMGVANFRSASWNRAPIDRMANINLEPGNSSLADMISQTEKGIFMQANRSWSIDDYRNKFQFGCEYAQLIENGKLTRVVKNPNYRGSTVAFWNSLKAIGNRQEFELHGSPYCGKGEPSQVIRVGHASPPCLFSQVEVFGGGK